MLTSRGLGTVLGDLASMGFDARWGVLGAADVGAPHQRDRIWIRARQREFLSHAEHDRNGWWQQQSESIEKTQRNVANTENAKWRAGQFSEQNKTVRTSRNYQFTRCSWWEAEPNVGRVADGVAARVDRLKAIGNGQVPLCAATAWKILNG
jgi:DNA (cytosine-5)-methyltransferase 1